MLACKINHPQGKVQWRGICLKFTVYGPPVPKGRPRFGKGRTFTPKRTLDYEKAVVAAAKSAGIELITGPVQFSVDLFLPDLRRRDLDNLCKSISDALNGLAYSDDSLICILRATKQVDRKNPRAEVDVSCCTGPADINAYLE